MLSSLCVGEGRAPEGRSLSPWKRRHSGQMRMWLQPLATRAASCASLWERGSGSPVPAHSLPLLRLTAAARARRSSRGNKGRGRCPEAPRLRLTCRLSRHRTIPWSSRSISSHTDCCKHTNKRGKDRGEGDHRHTTHTFHMCIIIMIAQWPSAKITTHTLRFLEIQACYTHILSATPQTQKMTATDMVLRLRCKTQEATGKSTHKKPQACTQAHMYTNTHAGTHTHPQGISREVNLSCSKWRNHISFDFHIMNVYWIKLQCGVHLKRQWSGSFKKSH